jgi:catalase
MAIFQLNGAEALRLVEEEDEHKFDFDLLDPTKIIPEGLVPVKRIGKLTLNRNLGNFFAETEQVAFHSGHIVPGIDVTNDPLLQGNLAFVSGCVLSYAQGCVLAWIVFNRLSCV